MDGYALKRLIRRPWLSVLGFIVSGALCTLLCLLTSYRDGQQKHLEEVRDSYEILCVITDVRGTKSDNLTMHARYTDFIQDEKEGLASFIDDLRMTKNFTYSSKLGTGSMIGVTNERCAQILDPRYGGVYMIDAEDFFGSNERICLVPEEMYAAYANQEISFTVSDPYGTYTGIGTDLYPFTVAGWYRGSGTEIYIPYETSQRMAAHLANSPSSDSVAFTLKDNDQIEEMLSVAHKLFQDSNPAAVYSGYAVTVRDKQFKATIAAIEQNIRRTEYLLPLIGILGLGAGFLLGFLAARGETKVYALMRTLGMDGQSLFITVLFEQLILPLLACIIVAVILRSPVSALAFFGCHLIGTVLALIRPVTAPPTRLLRASE